MYTGSMATTVIRAEDHPPPSTILVQAEVHAPPPSTKRENAVSAGPMNIFMEYLLMEIECPVCKTYMLPPITLCANGHNICSACRPNLTQCPKCAGNIFGIRCNTLEVFCTLITYPCRFKIYGCNAHCLLLFMDEHEKECPYRPFKCPSSISGDCTYRGIHLLMKKHIRVQHKYVDETHEFVRSFGPQKDIVTRGHILKFEQSFFFYGKAFENVVALTVMFVGSEEEAKKYKFKITVKSRDREHSMSICLECPSCVVFNDRAPTISDNGFALIPISFCNISTNLEGRVPFECEISKLSTEE